MCLRHSYLVTLISPQVSEETCTEHENIQVMKPVLSHSASHKITKDGEGLWAVFPPPTDPF